MMKPDYRLDHFGITAGELRLPSMDDYRQAARDLDAIPDWLRWAFPGRRRRCARAKARLETDFLNAVLETASSGADERRDSQLSQEGEAP